MRVFISYKSEHYEFARHVKALIESWGFNTWFDQDDIPKGSYFRHEIQKGLEDSDIVLGITTPDALQSREVQAEWDFAYSGACRLMLLLHQDVELPYHLRGVQYIDSSKNLELGIQQLEQALKSGDVIQSKIVKRSENTFIELDNRSAMLQKVQVYWVEGVLHNILGDSSSLEIGMESSAGAVLKHRNYEDYQFPENSLDIYELFKDMQNELLILGAPGSGKTVLLLQLAEKLIAEASNDENLPIPVLFNLSSWVAKRQSLRVWLIDELNSKYQVPKSIGKKWLEHEKLLLLLDGLDEVTQEHRAECLDAINAFRGDYRSVDMAICSRSYEYEVLTNKLDLQGAITLQPLCEEQVQDYLSDDSYIALCETMANDETLQNIAKVPFLLNTMAYAYYDVNPTMLILADGEKRFNHLFENYVEKRLRHSPSNNHYTPKEIRHYLKWLATNMVNHRITSFNIENLQSTWFDTENNDRVIYRGVRLISTLLSSILFGLLTVYLYGTPDAITSFIVGGVGGFIFIMPEQVSMVSNISWSWIRFVTGFLFGLFGAYLILFIYSLVVYVLYDYWLMPSLSYYIPSIPIICGIFSAFLGGISARKINFGKTTRPNESIILTAYLSLLSLPLGFMLFAIFTWFKLWMPDRIIGSIGGVGLAFLVLGGGAIIKHLTIRNILYFRGNIPFNYVKFLDYAADDLHILRKVGGSYIFRHRYLLEYFAGRELK